MVFVAKFLSPDIQGYYYTMISLATFSLVFEFGLASVLPIATSHYFTGLAWSVQGKVIGDKNNYHNFIKLLTYSVRWYLLASVLVLILLGPLGALYIDNGESEYSISWLGPWILLVFSTTLSILINPFLNIVEGSGEVAQAYLIRLIQILIGGIFALIVLYYGGGLYAVSMPSLFSFLIGLIWILSSKRKLILKSIKGARQLTGIREELFGVQWRALISWLAGYIMVLMYVPLLFKTQGAIVSGQMALTMNLVNMTSVLAASLLVSRLPSIASNISSKNWEAADSLFKRTMKLSVFLYFAGGFLVICLCLVLSFTKYSNRMLSLIETFILVIGMGFYHVSGLFANYLRAYLKEPMAKISFFIALISGLFAIIIAPIWGSYGIVWLVFLINLFLMFPSTLFLFIRLRKEWQEQ